MKKIVNGIEVSLTAEEITEIENERIENEKTMVQETLNNRRVERNQLLRDTDHHALADGTMSNEIKNYRISLRDWTNDLKTHLTDESIKDQVKRIMDKTFPTKPSE